MDKEISYKEAGVDVKKAADIVDDIKSLRKKTEKKHQLFNKFGDFSASLDLKKWTDPVISVACDGIGTKMELLQKYNLFETMGKDLVAMNINDIICSGASPVLFLDYLSSSKLDGTQIKRVISGIVEYLSECECILAGGETAEMPGILPKGLLEISGFCVGVAERDELINHSSICKGDEIVGFHAESFHANGFSLIRKLIATNQNFFNSEEMSNILLPTKLYWNEFQQMRKCLNKNEARIKGMAHITGGGMAENIKRVLEKHGASIHLPKWHSDSIQKISKKMEKIISKEEMLTTFNMGIGFVAILSPVDAKVVSSEMKNATMLGEVTDCGNVKVDFS